MIASPEIKPSLDPTDWLGQHGDYLYRYALARVRDAAVAEDLLQETLLAALRSHQHHEGRSSERTWLVGIMKHKVVDHFRLVARRPESQMCHDDARDEGNWFEKDGAWRGHWREDHAPVKWPVDAARLVESREFWETFDRCLSRLPRQIAIAFTLREMEGMDTNEICEILDVTPNNLWVMLHRGRAKLRQLLEVEWFRGRNPHTTSGTKNRNHPPMTAVRSELTYRMIAA